MLNLREDGTKGRRTFVFALQSSEPSFTGTVTRRRVGETFRRSMSEQDSCSLANSEKLITEEVGKGDGVVETDTSDTSDTADTSDTLTPGEGGSCGAGGRFWRRTGDCQPLHLQLQE